MRTLLTVVALLGTGIAAATSDVDGQTPAEKPTAAISVESVKSPSTSSMTPETAKPFANSEKLKATAESRILKEVGTAIEEIRTVQNGVNELQSGQETTHNLLRGIAVQGVEVSGSFASAKAKIEEARNRALAEIKSGTPVVVKEAIGTELENRGYTKPATPSNPTVAKKPKPASTTVAKSSQMWTKHNDDGSLGSMARPTSGKKAACKHCGCTGPCTGVNYKSVATTSIPASSIPANSYPAKSYSITLPGQVTYPAPSTCNSSACQANRAAQGSVVYYGN